MNCFFRSFLFLLFLTFQMSFSQEKTVTVSGTITDAIGKLPMPFVNVSVKSTVDGKLVSGVITDEQGRFSISNLPSAKYHLEVSFIGYKTENREIFVGSLSEFLDIGTISLQEDSQMLKEVIVETKTAEVASRMDKKTFSMSDNIAQSGGSVLQALQNLPGITVQDGKIQLRGNDKIMVLIDGKQTALTGYNAQTGLDNLAASGIEKIEIINNPSAKFDTNGNAGIINIVYKKDKQDGLTGKAGIASGYGALWERKGNLPGIRPQYDMTPKINPSLSLNYRKEKLNFFLQADYLYTETLNKNEFVRRIYENGSVVNQQTKRNRDTHFTNLKTGLDWSADDKNTISVSALFGSEKIADNGDEPFFNHDFSQRLRLWQFVEDELKTTAGANVSWQHKFDQPGHVFNASANYTFHREDERYDFTNILPDFTGHDAFKLLSDEQIFDFSADYSKPMKYGRIEAGVKFRYRDIPTNMQFYPSENSPIDADAGGRATYNELIPALYGNYVFENERFEAEAGLRMEYVHLKYSVDPNHPVYKSDGYDYTEPFPNLRLAWKFSNSDKISLFYNRRVDRPAEVDIRIFPKYDEAEIIKVGNPALRPQFTDALEFGYKHSMKKGYLFASAYHKYIRGTITRIATTQPGSTLIYNVLQNAGKSYQTGAEVLVSKELFSWWTGNLNLNAYRNRIDAFTVVNKYPEPTVFSAGADGLFSGNIKSNNTFKFSPTFSAQVSAVWQAPDLIPQGKTLSRFYVDTGVKKTVQKGKGEIFLNASDLFNSLVIRKEIQGDGFRYTSDDYYETQVIRFGYSYKF